jgi:hypothetical protein
MTNLEGVMFEQNDNVNEEDASNNKYENEQ